MELNLDAYKEQKNLKLVFGCKQKKNVCNIIEFSRDFEELSSLNLKNARAPYRFLEHLYMT